MAIKKVLAKSISIGIKIPKHKYQLRLRFKGLKKLNQLKPFISALDPSLSIDDIFTFPLEEMEYRFAKLPNLYFDVIKHSKYDYTLIVGYNDKDKNRVLNAVNKYIKLPKIKKS
ncbi:MAG: hypothetical protein AABW84_01200 [Nanoarchaeota archaeon]